MTADGASTRAVVARRSLLLGAAGIAGAGSTGVLSRAAAHDPMAGSNTGRLNEPLWRQAANGVVYGSSVASWQLEPEYRDLVAREAAVLFTEDDLLWYRLKQTPRSKLDFRFADRVIEFAERNRQLVFGAHLVWDNGFGDGWTTNDMRDLQEREARTLLFGTVRDVVRRYRGRIAAWVVANQVSDPGGRDGLRTDSAWHQALGPGYVAESFHIASQHDPQADLVLNESELETASSSGDPAARRRATLQVLDSLLDQGVPVNSLGIQAHLRAQDFADRFSSRSYRSFLQDVADRGLHVHITELDVLDDGLAADHRARDRAVADVYRRYLDVTLDVAAVKTVVTFGLSDRFSWLQEDYPRHDGAGRRPLPFDRALRPKPAYYALSSALRQAPHRRPAWAHPRR
ncbi:MAG TPA: endo-1,4-beta-xylanase [Nocardioidaceae bacterium]|nr:endo-1,4-beta-xylanase [Nocardioidaceae bacterium]